MFNSKEDPKVAEVSNSTNSISNGTLLKGDIETAGKLRIDGKVIGNITTRSKLVLGQTSHIKGDVHAQNADLEGELHGNIRVTETLTLKPTAVIHGDIFTNKLIVESGAAFNGSCKMGASADLNINRTHATTNRSQEKPETSDKSIRQENVKAG